MANLDARSAAANHRRSRRDPVRPLRPPTPASADVNHQMDSVPATLEDVAAQDASVGVQCPLCGAERDAYCTSPITGRHLHGRTSHWQRIKAARMEDQT
jgi:hypothetical protein